MTEVTTFDGPVPGEALAVGGRFSTGRCRKAPAVGNKRDQGHPCHPTGWHRVGEPKVLWGYGCRDASRTEARPENDAWPVLLGPVGRGRGASPTAMCVCVCVCACV